MNATDYRISFRVDERVKHILDELIQLDATESQKWNRVPLNRSQIIIQAIKEYYAARVNGQAQNSYLDLIDARLSQILDGYFTAERAHITNNSREVKKELLKTVTMIGLILQGTELGKREDLVRKYLDEVAAFESPINEYVNKKVRW